MAAGCAVARLSVRHGAVRQHRGAGKGANPMLDQMTSATAPNAATGRAAIRPFAFEVPHADLEDLRRRVGATKWPERELVADASQGVQLATTQKLARYWATDYDWRACEARLK